MEKQFVTSAKNEGASYEMNLHAKLEEFGLNFVPLARTISVMQVIWGGRWQVGSACSTSEEVEQINSHMSR